MDRLSEEVLSYCLSYLTIEETIQSSQISTQFLIAVRQERLWKSWLLESFGIDSLEYPPDSEHPVDSSFQHCYKSWRIFFTGYDVKDVRRTREWWRRFESWCQQYSPEILSTLNPPASESELNLVETHLHRCLPSPLRLFYRFHNGQNVPFDSDRNHTKSIGWGMFGGTQFYDSLVNMRFLPVQTLFEITQQWAPGTILPHPKVNCYPAQNSSQFYCSDDDVNSPISNHSVNSIPLNEHLVVFAANGLRRVQKVYCLGCASPSSRGGVVYVNTREYQYFPCHPISQSLTLNSTQQNLESFFLLWLEEYLRRLESEIYQFQPVDLTDPAIQLNPVSIKKRHAVKMISLHPLRPLHNPIFPHSPEYSRRNYGATIRITRGVECVACPVFIPEKSNSEEYFWSYSIRLRLLKDNPERPTSLTRCQLISRHWDIFEPPTSEDLTSGNINGRHQRVDGEAVIGLYPQLDIAYSQPPMNWPFAYQSCTTSSTFPGQFSGHMKFVHGSLQSPNGPQFNVNLEPFSLGIPDFIY